MHDLTCAEVLDSAPQFALDILEPSRRSLVAAHLIRCPVCRGTVSGMQESAAALLDLDGADWRRPWPDPALTASPVPPPRSGRRRVRRMMTLATAAVLMVGTAFGPELEASSHHSPAPLARAALLDGARTVGYVNFYAGGDPALDLQVSGVAARGSVTCETVGPDGTVTQLGTFGLYQGHGYWATNRVLDPRRISSVVLVDEQGRVLTSTSPSATVF